YTPIFWIILVCPWLFLVIDDVPAGGLLASLSMLIHQCCCLSVRVCFNPAGKSFHTALFHQMFDGVINCAGGFVSQGTCQGVPLWVSQAAVPVCVNHEVVINRNCHWVFHVFKKSV